MNDRQTHIEHFERQTHRVCEKPFAPGVVTNARDLDSDDFRDLTPAETLFVYAAFVVFLVGLVGSSPWLSAGCRWCCDEQTPFLRPPRVQRHTRDSDFTRTST